MATFETKICNRCGGTGEYSYNQMYGRVCFKCRGNKTVMTKRGLAAYSFYENLISVEAGTLNIGDKFFMTGVAKAYTVISIEKNIKDYNYSNNLAVRIVTDNALIGMPETEKVKKVWSKEEKNSFLQQAIAYQATLTATGKPKKTK